MTDEQCNAIIDAIKDLTTAVNLVAEEVGSIYYSDSELVKKLDVIANVLEFANR